MIRGVFKQFWNFIKFHVPVYNFNSEIIRDDEERSISSLISDLQGKRILLNTMSRKLANTFYSLVAVVVIFIGYIVLDSNNLIVNNHGLSKRNFECFTDRSFANITPETAIEFTELELALSLIHENEFEAASSILKNSKNEDAIWIKAICYIQLNQEKLAKTELQGIINRKGQYSLRAKELFDNYYK